MPIQYLLTPPKNGKEAALVNSVAAFLSWRDCYIGDSSADRHACTTSSSGTEISFSPTLVRIFPLDETCLTCLFLLAGFLASLPGRGGKGLYILYSTVCTLCTRLQVAPFFEGDISFRARNFNWQLRNMLLGKKGESRHVFSLACGGITHDTLKGIYPMPPPLLLHPPSRL